MLSDFSTIAQAIPFLSDGHYLAGLTLEDLGRHQEAITALTRAIEMGPNDADSRMVRAQACCALASWDGAIADLTEMARIGSDNGWSLVQRGAIHSLRGNTELSQADQRAALESASCGSLGKWDPGLFAPAAAVPEAISDSPPVGDHVLAEFNVQTIREPLTIPVRMGGRTLRFAIDTGASSTFVDRSHRDLLGPQCRQVDAHTVERTVRLPLFEPQPLAIGGMTMTPAGQITCADVTNVMRSAPNAHLDGLLGMDVLSRLVMRIDMARHTVYFLSSCGDDPGLAIPLIGGVQKIDPRDPLSPRRSPQVLLTLPDGSQERATVDTGMLSSALALDANVYARLMQTGSITHIRAMLGATLSGSPFFQTGLMSQCALGGFAHHCMLVDQHPAGTALGLSYLARYVVTFDFPNGRMFLKPSPLFAVSEAELTLRLGGSWSGMIGNYTPTEALDALNRDIRAAPKRRRRLPQSSHVPGNAERIQRNSVRLEHCDLA